MRREERDIAARRLNPAHAGELDGPLWLIGRKWCVAGAPLCGDCPVGDVCPKGRR